MTGLANGIGLAALVVGLVAASAGRASAGYTYNVSLSVPNEDANFLGYYDGNVSVVGTITVDNLGTLTSASDITGYTLAFSSDGNPTTIVTSSNGTVDLSGVTLMATSTTLTGEFPNFAGTSEFSIFDNLNTTFFGIELQFQEYAGSFKTLRIDNQSENPGAAQDNGASYISSETFTVGTAVVPEPSSAALTMIGAGTVLACGWVRKLRQRCRQAAV